MPSTSYWQNAYKAIAVYSMVALAVSLTACAKGFKLKEDLTQVKALPVAALPVAPTTTTYNPLIDLAAEKNEEIKALVNDPANKGKIQIQGKIGFILKDLDPKRQNSAETSDLYFEITVQAGDKSVTTLIVSDSANLSLIAINSSDVRISGYWTINRSNSSPAYIGIDSRLKQNGMALNLAGALYGNFHGEDDPPQLNTFDLPLCTVAADTSWLKTVYGAYVDESNCSLMAP